ncbi:MAG: hypothetical protein DFNUSKGM_003206, partial [Candidatus Fervidibacter sacchari]
MKAKSFWLLLSSDAQTVVGKEMLGGLPKEQVQIESRLKEGVERFLVPAANYLITLLGLLIIAIVTPYSDLVLG